MRIRYYQTFVRAGESNLTSLRLHAGVLHHSYTMFQFYESALIYKSLQPIINSLHKRHLTLL